ncbi:hypothetical protein [Bartonella sp. B41]
MKRITIDRFTFFMSEELQKHFQAVDFAAGVYVVGGYNASS